MAEKITLGRISFVSYLGTTRSMGPQPSETSAFKEELKRSQPTKVYQLLSKDERSFWAWFYLPHKSKVVHYQEQGLLASTIIGSIPHQINGIITVTPEGRVYQHIGLLSNKYSHLYDSAERRRNEFMAAVKELPNDGKTKVYFLMREAANTAEDNGIILAERDLDNIITRLTEEQLGAAMEGLRLYPIQDVSKTFPFLRGVTGDFFENFFNNYF